MKNKNELSAYEMTIPGFEAVYTGETDLSLFKSDENFYYDTDDDGNVYFSYSLWGFAHNKPEKWNDEIRYINKMQLRLGKLDQNIRRIRQHISSLVCCDNGVPTTIDEILDAIGIGQLPSNPFHPGCWISNGTRTTQPLQAECMQAIKTVLEGLIANKLKEELITKYPFACGFISRCYDWFDNPSGITEIQKLMLQRVLLPFEFFTEENENYYECDMKCFGENGLGQKIDEKIADIAGLPKIFPNYKKEYHDALSSVSDQKKKELYTICGHISHGVYGLSDCHHNTFRFIERWIHGIATQTWEIPTRINSRERQRLGRLLFGYSLALDRWLQGVPHQFLLLDLGHIDIGFDPANEILRVYAYLGSDRTPAKEWLAASLWYTLMIWLKPPARLTNWGTVHKDIIEKTGSSGISNQEWMDSKIKTS